MTRVKINSGGGQHSSFRGLEFNPYGGFSRRSLWRARGLNKLRVKTSHQKWTSAPAFCATPGVEIVWLDDSKLTVFEFDAMGDKMATILLRFVPVHHLQNHHILKNPNIWEKCWETISITTCMTASLRSVPRLKDHNRASIYNFHRPPQQPQQAS